MWHTNSGERTLQGAEAILFASALRGLLDDLEDNYSETESLTFDIPLFDNLEFSQRVGLLCEVGRALLIEEINTFDPTAIREAAIGALFAWLAFELDVEIDMEDCQWRSLVHAACEEVGLNSESESPLPHPTSRDAEEWHVLIEELQFRILSDRDWLYEDLSLDSDPERVAEVKELAGIQDDYYTAIPPDLSESELERAKKDLEHLCETIICKTGRSA